MKRVVLALVVAVSLAGCGDVTWLPDPKVGPVITTSSLPTAPFALNYSQTLTATGGKPPYTWSLASPQTSLPPGLVLNANGTITNTQASPPAGNTANAGTYIFTVSVTDTQSPPQTSSKNLSIFAPTTGRMYDSTHVVYAETLSTDTLSPPQSLLVNMGNQGTIAHSVLAVAANYDNSGSEIAGSTVNLTVTNLAAGTATTSPVTANIPAGAINATVNNWRIKSVSLP